MVRLGRLVLDGGRYGDHALLPADWLAELRKPRVTATGHGLRYGWQWWVGRVAQGAAGSTGWFAGLGNGGQVLVVVPALDASVVVTAGRYNSPASERRAVAGDLPPRHQGHARLSAMLPDAAATSRRPR